MPYGNAENANSQTVTITSGNSITSAIDLGRERLAGIGIPAAWTAASIGFTVSHNGTTFYDLFDRNGNEYLLSVAADRCITLDIADLSAYRFIKVRSGTKASPVNQGDDRSLVLFKRIV